MTHKTLLQINVSANSGSTGKIAEQIGKTAKEAGWDSIIAFGKRCNESSSTLIRIGNKSDIIYHGIQTRLFDRHGLASFRATKHFLSMIDKMDIDIVHLHNIHGYYINYPLLFDYLQKRNLPIVWTLHDCWPFTGHCSHFDYLGCDKWKRHCEKCPGLRTYPKSLFADRSDDNYEDKKRLFGAVADRLYLIPVSNWLEGFVRQSFLKDSANITTIHNGIDIETFTPSSNDAVRKKYSIPENKKIVLGVAASWTERKGYSDFFALRDILIDDYEIVLIGLSKEQNGKLPLGMIGLERTENQKELAALYATASVFVNPTYEDNYPTTNLEALSCGTPVITYNTGGSHESVTDETGAVVEKGNIRALKDAIERLCGLNRDNKVSLMCRKWAELHCDSRFVYSQYIKIYDSLIQ